MNIKDNQRTRLTKRLLAEALFDLMDSGMPVDKISVKKLCDTAEISRSTFYLHYEDPTDVLAEIEETLLKEYEEYDNKTYKNGGDDLLMNVTSFVRFLRNNELFARLIRNSTNPEFAKRCFENSYKKIQVLDIDLIPGAKELVLAYIAEGSFAFFKSLFAATSSLSDKAAAEIMIAMSTGAIQYAYDVCRHQGMRP